MYWTPCVSHTLASLKQFLCVKPKNVCQESRQVSAPQQGWRKRPQEHRSWRGCLQSLRLVGISPGERGQGGEGSRPWGRALSVVTEASWPTEGARGSSCLWGWGVSSTVMSQLGRASQIPNFMLFMNNGSVVSTQPEEFKIKNVLLLVTLERTTESQILYIL